MFVPNWLIRTAGAVALVALGGCSGGASGPVATVSGNITHNGAPLNGAKVIFHSTVEESGKRGNSYAALTDSNGKYLIVGVGKELGIPPGLYKVTITKMDTSAKAGIPKEIADDPGQLMAAGIGTNLLPKDYENEKTTKLSATLEVGKNENVNFDLKGTGGGSKAEKVP
jgi:hypothetical protein